MRKLILTSIIFGLMLIHSIAVSAQSIPSPISLSATPESPAPGEEFTIETATPTFDKNAAAFTWKINGRTRSDLSGIGKNSINLTAGNVGSITRIKVEVLAANGSEGEAEISVVVSDLTLLWSANTYVPKWYKGKALPIPGSTVNVVAVPNFILNGRLLPPQSLIFRWSVDGELKLSGINRPVFRIQMPEFANSASQVDLVVEDITRQIKKENSVAINAYYPKTLVYTASPLGGVEHRLSPASISSTFNKLVDLIAEPFHFPVQSKKNLIYRWLVAGSEIQGQAQDQSVLTIDTGKEGGRSAPVSVYVQDTQGAASVNRKIDLILSP